MTTDVLVRAVEIARAIAASIIRRADDAVTSEELDRIIKFRLRDLDTAERYALRDSDLSQVADFIKAEVLPKVILVDEFGECIDA